VFSSLRASLRGDEFLKIFRAWEYFGHLITMCSIDRITLHAVHYIGAGSLVMRNESVRWVWPILAWVMMTSSLLFRLPEKFHFLIWGLMVLNLFDRGTLDQFFCHVSSILRLMMLSDFEDEVRFSFGVYIINLKSKYHWLADRCISKTTKQM